jgi:large subunit ribosomal protein L24
MKPLVYRKSRRGRGEKRGREPARHKLHVAKGDTVRVLRGDDRGKEGKILHVYPKTFRVTVEGVNIVKRHQKARTPEQRSEIIERPAPVDASKVMLLDPKSGKPTRVRRRRDQDGTVERIAVRSGQPIPRVR